MLLWLLRTEQFRYTPTSKGGRRLLSWTGCYQELRRSPISRIRAPTANNLSSSCRGVVHQGRLRKLRGGPAMCLGLTSLS